MEFIKNSNFSEMSICEMQETDGGLVPLIPAYVILSVCAVGIAYSVYKNATSRK